MIFLDVILELPDGNRMKCGEIASLEPREPGTVRSEFRYVPGYLSHSDAFPLDPVVLPLKEGSFRSPRKEAIFQVFEDALPDDWGMRLLLRRRNVPANRQYEKAYLLHAMGDRALGALSFKDNPAWKDAPRYEPVTRKAIELARLHRAAHRFEQGLNLNDQEVKDLLEFGSLAGGQRPKAVFRGEDGSEWIAKFPSLRDAMNIPEIEAASLTLARMAGLNTPDARLVKCNRRNVLLVRRFDITPQGGRYHMVSMKTLLRAEGYYVHGYQDILDIILKYGGEPREDSIRLYRQMVFNAYIGNTDDHLKNFTMLHIPNRGYVLSPCYDMLPNQHGGREHVLNFGLGGNSMRGTDMLVQMGRDYWPNLDANKIVSEVADVVSEWKAVFNEYEVPNKQIQRLVPDMEMRFKKNVLQDVTDSFTRPRIRS